MSCLRQEGDAVNPGRERKVSSGSLTLTTRKTFSTTPWGESFAYEWTLKVPGVCEEKYSREGQSSRTGALAHEF